MKRKIVSILFALVLVLSFSLVTAVPAAAFFWDAELRAEITSPQEGECILVGSTFTVEVTIYNDGTDNAEVVSVDCRLNGGWPAGEYPGQNLAFAEGETQVKHTPPGIGIGGYTPIEPGDSMDFTWQVVCTGPGVTKIMINPSAIGEVGEADIVTFYQVPSKADILKDSGVPGKGLDKAPGLQKPFNPKSKAEDHVGKK